MKEKTVSFLVGCLFVFVAIVLERLFFDMFARITWDPAANQFDLIAAGVAATGTIICAGGSCTFFSWTIRTPKSNTV